jgi:hypothetical protein
MFIEERLLRACADEIYQKLIWEAGKEWSADQCMEFFNDPQAVQMHEALEEKIAKLEKIIDLLDRLDGEMMSSLQAEQITPPSSSSSSSWSDLSVHEL